jgi:hypothetical protein
MEKVGTITFLGDNAQWKHMVDELNAELTSPVQTSPIAAAVATGRFRGADKTNRKRFALTAELLDLMCFPYSKKINDRWMRRMLIALKCGVPLTISDMEAPL